MRGLVSVSVLNIEKFSLVNNVPHKRTLEMIAEMGAKGVDLFEDYFYPHPHADIYQLKKFREMVHKIGLEISSCWYYVDPIRASYASSVDDVLAQLREYIAITNYLECKYLIMPPGEPMPFMDRRTAQDALMHIYEELIPDLDAYDVTIGMEVGRMHSPISSPGGALEIIKRMQNPRITVCPDWEGWRRHNDAIPDFYAECPEILRDPPGTIEDFEECLPYAPYIHAKLFQYDEQTGLDPNFPLEEMFAAINKSPLRHNVSLEYEGWISDCFPEVDLRKITKQLFDMLEKNLK